MSDYHFIKILDQSPVVSLILNRPPLNVLTIAMMREMNAALASIRVHPTARVFLIQAEGKAFSAGVDVADHTADKVDEMMDEFHSIFENLCAVKIPTLAVVDGAALGGGCEVALACDMIIASDRANFGQPEVKVGVFPPIAAALLPRCIGRNRTLEFLMTGDTITAAEAERIGMVNKVFPQEGFAEQVGAFVGKLAGQSRVVLEMTKRAVDGSLLLPSMHGIGRATALYMEDMMKTEDANEGLKAFLEKRQPTWSDR